MTISDEMSLLWREIRRTWTRFSPNRRLLLDRSKRQIPKLKKDGTPGKKMINVWPCAVCGEWVSERDVDHHVPIGRAPRCDVEVGPAATKLFCDIDNLRILCKSCHHKKSAEERKEGAYK